MAPNAPILGQIVQFVISVYFVACYRLHFFLAKWIQRRNQMQKLGRFLDPNCCLYFGPGFHWEQARSQAQNTSKNDNLENGLIFLFDFCVGTASQHLYRGPGCAQFEWTIFLN